jgi:hypothetical protein
MKNPESEKQGQRTSLKARSIDDRESTARRMSRRGFLGNMMLVVAVSSIDPAITQAVIARVRDLKEIRNFGRQFL